MKQPLILITGAGGFIGGHLVARLRREGLTNLRCVDLKKKEDWHQRFDDAENITADLSDKATCYRVTRGAEQLYNFAADMGGMGFIENNKALCMLSVLINTHLLMAARDGGVQRYFYASSACVYSAAKQTSLDVQPLKESDAYPALPEDGYGWEKLFSERMCRHFSEDFGISTRIARLHNVYGPYGAWEGGREKAPAAICRKVVHAQQTGDLQIEVWGDGRQVRSFLYIDDCIEGIRRIMDSEIEEPINLGSSELVSVNQLVDMVEHIAGVALERIYDFQAPQGVRGRGSDNTLIRQRLGWEPTTRLVEGLRRTYSWIYAQHLKTYSRDSRRMRPPLLHVDRHTPLA